MNIVNNVIMKKVENCKNIKGVYYIKKRLLKFEKPYDLLSDDDMLNLFMGFVRLIKRSAEIEVESKYLSQIKNLENKIKNFEK